jgi:NhaP-type Na+/H+ or K+/H+ antiporter
MLLLVFGVALLAAVLLSERFHRTILSATLLFLIVGFVAGRGVTGLLSVRIGDPLVAGTSDAALVVILFSDALRLGWETLRSGWRLPGRALVLGLPLTVLGTAAAGHWLLSLAWSPAFLVGAILAPTDPVFASAIIGRPEIPARLRHLLNVESGLNDGLALPIVMALMGALSATAWQPWATVRDTLGGVAFGAVAGYLGGALRKLPAFEVTEPAAPLHALAILITTYSGSRVLHVNQYLAAFSAGIAASSAYPDLNGEYRAFGDHVSQLFKVAAVFLFALMLSGAEPWPPLMLLVFGLVVLTAVRFAALEVSLFGSGLTRAERLTAIWFGPKGFASVVYSLLLLGAGIADADRLFSIIALVIVLSMVLHSSTDVPVARYFERAGSLAPRAASSPPP